jgi:hypothetical protein
MYSSTLLRLRRVPMPAAEYAQRRAKAIIVVAAAEERVIRRALRAVVLQAAGKGRGQSPRAGGRLQAALAQMLSRAYDQAGQSGDFVICLPRQSAAGTGPPPEGSPRR